MKLLNQSQLAKELGVSTWTIANWRRAGAPFFGRWTTVEDIVRWLRKNPAMAIRRSNKEEPSAGPTAGGSQEAPAAARFAGGGPSASAPGHGLRADPVDRRSQVRTQRRSPRRAQSIGAKRPAVS